MEYDCIRGYQTTFTGGPNGLTCRELTDEILARKMYSFNTPTPNNIVNHELRKHCEGLNFPSAHPVKYFAIAQSTGKSSKAVYRLIVDNPSTTTSDKEVEYTEQVDTASVELLLGFFEMLLVQFCNFLNRK